jgi:FkbM family methyltransferase
MTGTAPPPRTFIAANEYGRYCIPQSSAHRPSAILVREGYVWERDTIAFMRAHCGTGDVVHAGTFFGDFLPALASALAPGAFLWAFEPNPENFACATHTVALNGLGNVRLHFGAMTRMAGTLRIETMEDDISLGGASHVVPGDSVSRSTVEVPGLVLDAVVATRPVSIIQLDVEDHEQAALDGALKTIARNRPIILVETEPSAAWFDAHLRPLGYRRDGEVDANVIYRCAVRAP